MKAKDWFKDFARGSSMGLGMIPGVSAGTMGIIVGIYDKFISSLANLRKDFKNNLISIIPIFLGFVIGSLLIVIGVHFGYNYAPFAITCAFAGLIIGTLPIITKEIKGSKISAKTCSLIGIGFVVAAGLGVLSAIAALMWDFDLVAQFSVPNPEWWVYLLTFFAGFIAAVACIIPGVSGTMILFLLGIYNGVVGVYMGDNSMFKNHDRIASGLIMTLLLGIGIIAGFLLVSKAMKALLSKHRVPTFQVVLGFVVGSIVSMFVNNNFIVIDKANGNHWLYQDIPMWEFIAGPILLLGVAAIFFYLTRKSQKDA